MTDTKVLSHEELVKQKYPTAFVYDDVGWVYIKFTTSRTDPCPRCGQSWTREVTMVMYSLGSGGSSSAAWESAAQNLGLIN